MSEKEENRYRKNTWYEIWAGIIGFIIGDAQGVPVEFIGRESLKENKKFDMEEYGTHNQPKGT